MHKYSPIKYSIEQLSYYIMRLFEYTSTVIRTVCAISCMPLPCDEVTCPHKLQQRDFIHKQVIVCKQHQRDASACSRFSQYRLHTAKPWPWLNPHTAIRYTP